MENLKTTARGFHRFSSFFYSVKRIGHPKKHTKRASRGHKQQSWQPPVVQKKASNLVENI